jgi:hypothetical protein
MEQFDKYRAQELAYGHAGFVGNLATDNVYFVAREHHLMHAVQRLYGAALPTEIRYEIDGQFVTASAAVAAGETRRQRIRYDSGLTLWVNWRPEVWEVEGHRLPQWGFLALGPETRVATELHGPRVADYAECPEYIFADARTDSSASGARPQKDIEPRLASFKYLGDGRAKVTYEWIVNDTLAADCQCLVHGVNSGSAQPEQIVFQGDHVLKQPTSTWRAGARVIDGPHEITVPATFDHYDLVIGLYKGQRVRLKGTASTDDRVVVARLVLGRSGGRVTGITVDPPPKIETPKDEADFSAHLNPPGTWIDFGPVATDGAVKINREKERLIIFPYPRDKKFRASLELKALAPAADPAKVKVRILAGGDSHDLGPADFRWEKGRLMLTLGKAGAGRYAVQW